MNEQDILNQLGIGENRDWEFKAAKGGLPQDLWETYSAMANTEGGVMVCGIAERNGSFEIVGVSKPDQMRRDFWNTINNRGKISINLLAEHDVTLRKIQGCDVLAIQVPRADRKQRPVYVGQNPILGTFRRNYDGDFKCSEDEVKRMLAEQAEDWFDARILDGFTIDDLDSESLIQYKNRFTAAYPNHPWLSLDNKQFLTRLGGWRRDRKLAVEGLTVAGLLMFGKDESIADPNAVPKYHVDYREKLSDDPEERWTDRLTVDGTWTANLFQFYSRTLMRLTRDLRIPFRMAPDLFRTEDTPVHEAMREALANAMMHADYSGDGGVIIGRHKSRVAMSNPGTLLISEEQIRKGGVSVCRNPSVQRMFQMMGSGEKAGSGLDKIKRGWESQQWRPPTLEERVKPDRVVLSLPMESLLPPESVDRLRSMFGSKVDSLSPKQLQTLVTADVEGEVSNIRMQMMSDTHPSDLTKMLQDLTRDGFLEPNGNGRWRTYQIRQPQLAHKHWDLAGNRSNLVDNEQYLVGNANARNDQLNEIAAPARSRKRLPPEQMAEMILRLCQVDFLSISEIGQLIQRNPKDIGRRYVSPLVRRGLLRMRYPDEPHRPDQAYRADVTSLHDTEM